MEVYISQTQTRVTGATPAQRAQLRAACTYEWLDHKRRKRQQDLSDELRGVLYVPRFAPFLLDDAFAIHNSIGDGEAAVFEQRGTLNLNQELICDHVVATYLNLPDEGDAGVNIIMPTGAGKTYVGLGLIARLQRRTLVVCPKRDLVDQWTKVAAEFFVDASSVTAVCVASLYRTEPAYFTQFGCVVFDEAHCYASAARAAVLAKCQRKYMIGLTATPRRKDNSHLIIELNIGPLFNALETPGYSHNPVTFAAEVRMIKYSGPYRDNIYNGQGDIDYSNTLNQILDDPARVRRIAEAIVDIDDRNVFVFADRREYLLLLKAEVERLRGLEEGGEYHVVLGGGAKEEAEEAARSARVIFTTYQLYGTGTSIPRMNAIVFATPRKDSLTQPLGRIFRGTADIQTKRKVVDLVDWQVPVFRAQWRTRKALYVDRGFDIVEGV